jgi:hypothetical protein
VGSSYENLLVAAPLERVLPAVVAVGVPAAVATVAPGRTAVLPGENAHGYAETAGLATTLSMSLRCPVIAFQVYDSDVVYAQRYDDGVISDSYVSSQEALVDIYQEADGTWWQKVGGVVYPYPSDEVRIPTGPLGDNPAVFLPFAVGQADLEKLAVALSEPQVFAERQHWDILAALNLDPRLLTLAYRHIEDAGLSDAVNWFDGP